MRACVPGTSTLFARLSRRRICSAPAGDERWTAPAAAFRRWLLPEFDMRLGLVKRACEGVSAVR